MQVTIIIEREESTPIEFKADVAMVGKMQTISDIEGFLLSLSAQALPDLGEQLVAASQQDYISKKKVNGMVHDKLKFIP